MEPTEAGISCRSPIGQQSTGTEVPLAVGRVGLVLHAALGRLGTHG